jgi:hypothetical protein
MINESIEDYLPKPNITLLYSSETGYNRVIQSTLNRGIKHLGPAALKPINRRIQSYIVNTSHVDNTYIPPVIHIGSILRLHICTTSD